MLPFELGAFTDQDGAALIQRLGNDTEYSLSISDEVAKAVVQHVGWPVPFYLQLMFHAIAELPKAERSDNYPSVSDVETAYRELLSPTHRVKFAHWDSRLGDLLDAADVKLARTILVTTCRVPAGKSREVLIQTACARSPGSDLEQLAQQVRDLLHFLERDGYLIESNGSYAFRSFLLRNYWERRYA